MLVNKEMVTKFIIRLAANDIKPCIKHRMDNIIFPKWNELGLLGMIFRQDVRTKEQPNGYVYAEASYQVVMRLIGGRVLMTGGCPDTYAWRYEKVQKHAESMRLIGINSSDGLINLAEALSSIEDEKEKHLFAEMFCNLRKDMLLITTPKEERLCIEIDEKLYRQGIRYCVDEWMETDDNGDAEATLLRIGDHLIVSPDHKSLYCIRHDEFVQTHSLLTNK